MTSSDWSYGIHRYLSTSSAQAISLIFPFIGVLSFFFLLGLSCALLIQRTSLPNPDYRGFYCNWTHPLF
jgi:hypothetical protein